MKRYLFLLFTCLLLFLQIQSAHASDKSYRIYVEGVINRRNILIEHPETKEKYLIYLGSGCGTMEKGQTVDIVVRGSLNSNLDRLKADSIHSCAIEFAEPYNETLFVEYVFNGNTTARVRDESGAEYFMNYGEFCRSIPRYMNTLVYVLKGDDKLSKGDRLYLPNMDGQCSVDTVTLIPDYQKLPVDQKPSDSRPTSPTSVKAFPRNGAVFLSWRAAKDDHRISHYIVSSSENRIYTKDLDAENMPNQVTVKSTHVTLSDLTNDRPYYFYVIAVDDKGQMSSSWSEEAIAVPKASISVDLSSSSVGDMNLKVSGESSLSFLIQWKPLIGSNRQTVVFEVDGKREFARTNYSGRFIRILKKDSREGKELRIRVFSYDLRGLLKEESITFGF